ncbi:aldehyde dehydrogenase [Nonomuraea roseoviolacea]|uniref:Betaine-aldehyde dehydrogenase n=1 Tax=Nonomuraea roseoviolacea subsp. carminata TaxID=160689 RepID=A0ABT1KB34_9ACTN|nr:aldehyde dehydrogenase [Nonomuraea roseoviolacea]MCP2351176.1 betaine-aldehyde dehydrogenase [Nonomuraea roseoviolacea subsp. carminata]
MREYTQLYIGGGWTDPATGAVIEVVSPHTEEVVGRAPEGSPADMDRAVAAAREAFDDGPWPRMSPAERGEALGRLAAAYEARQAEMAETITAEMGCTLAFSQLAQAPMAHAVLSYYAGLGDSLVVESERQGLFAPITVRREPVGVVAAIVPWNTPQFLTMTKMAPALLAGCAVVVKPAPETPLDAQILAELVDEAGLPPGVVGIVPAGRESGEHLVRHPGVDKVAFTGSTAAGRRIGALCAEQLRRCSLELGGKSAAILLDDADLDAYIGWLPLTSFIISGQGCIAQTRVLVRRDRVQEVLDRLSEACRAMRMGDPFDPATELGPLATARQRDKVEGYIRLGQEEGAKLVAGGGRRGFERGWYVEPTVFLGDNTMRVAREEIFGPVLVVIPYEDEEDAIRLANDSEYGLGGSVWTRDAERGLAVARRVRTGVCAVNGFLLDPVAPFGGFKASGMGRELGPEGLDGYLEYKSIPRMG